MEHSTKENIIFPLGIAEGQYFCNRQLETKQLLRNIQNCIHTVLISPRRYGKTSLAYRAICQSHLPNTCIDLYMTTTTLDVEKTILSGVNHLLSQVSNNAELLLGLIKDYVKSLRTSFEASKEGLRIKLEPIEKTATATHVCEALQILDNVLKKKAMQAVLLIDEFQEVQRIAPDHGFEGAIRHVAQSTKHISLIFSGSHRHLLSNMFNNRSKPLYRLCDEIQLTRISEEDYLPFIEKFAHEKWGKPLSQKIIHTILSYSECHSYYVNAICEKLFALEHAPTLGDVDIIWNNLIVLKKKDVLQETKNLNLTQKKLLVAIAHGMDHELTGKKFLSHAELSGASVVRALDFLEEHDFIEKNHTRYYLIDPLLKEAINQLTYF